MNEPQKGRGLDFTDDELKALYERYAPVLYQRCLSILRNPEGAQDAVHETFAKVIKNASTFRQQSSPLTWMYRISTNHCLNQIRNSSSRRAKHHVHREEIAGSGIAQANDERTDQDRLMALLGDADEETRRCVLHTYFDDCTREEVATLVGLSVPTVRKRINTFLDRARKTFGAAALATLAVLGPMIPWSLQ